MIERTPRTSTPAQDRLLEAVSDPVRRAVIRVLEQDGPASLSELATALEDDDADEPSHERIATALHHRHAPVLADADLARYRENEPVLALTDRGRTVGESLHHGLVPLSPGAPDQEARTAERAHEVPADSPCVFDG